MENKKVEKETLKVGDVVFFKGGSPNMVIVKIDYENYTDRPIYCEWYGELEKKFVGNYFAECCLEKI